MGKLPKRKRLQMMKKRSHDEVDADQEKFYNNGGEDDDFDDEDEDVHEDAAAGFGSAPPNFKLGRTEEANMRDMEYLEKARIEREKRKDPKFQQQQRLIQALQRKQELDARHEEEMMARKRLKQ